MAGNSSDDLRTPFAAMVIGAVRAELDSWASALRDGSTRPLMAHYSSDALIVQAGGPFVKGARAVRRFADAVDESASHGFLSMLDADVSDGIAYVYGAYDFQPAKAGSGGSSGRHVTIFRREDDEWRIRLQLYAPEGDGMAFPGVEGSADPESIDLGVTEGGEVPRPAFLAAITSLAGVSRAWAERDAEGVAEAFAPNGLLQLPGDSAPARGDAIRAAMEDAFDRFGPLETLELDFTASGRLAVILGRHSLGASPESGVAGHYILVLARTGARWSIRSLVLG